ncbi:hypothetical protein [Azospirillum largimobile]
MHPDDPDCGSGVPAVSLYPHDLIPHPSGRQAAKGRQSSHCNHSCVESTESRIMSLRILRNRSISHDDLIRYHHFITRMS